jgi:hypothetical protein
MSSEPSLRRLFEEYASTSLGPAPEELARFYGDSFLVAGPGGSAAFQNDDQFLAWLSQVHEFNEQAGMRSLEVVSVAETPVSHEYSLVRVEWGARFLKTGDELIQFEISYLLRLTQETPKIVAYISHEDQEEVMKARGLL